jgi:hypothetical protein
MVKQGVIMLNFDLFDALRHMKDELGKGSELMVREVGTGIEIRLSVYDGDQYHHRQFKITSEEMGNAFTNIMNLRFKHNVQLLHRQLIAF